MTMQQLNIDEIGQVSGGLTLGLGFGGLTIDLGALMNGGQSALNAAIDGMQDKIDSLAQALPARPAFTVPVLGLTIALTITR